MTEQLILRHAGNSPITVTRLVDEHGHTVGIVNVAIDVADRPRTLAEMDALLDDVKWYMRGGEWVSADSASRKAALSWYEDSRSKTDG